MPKYRVTIKRVITPEKFTKRTGIDLSHTDLSKLKPVEVEERVVNGKRSDIFALMRRSIGPLGGNVFIQLA